VIPVFPLPGALLLARPDAAQHLSRAIWRWWMTRCATAIG
jgi:hypothetical protein